MNLTDYQSIWFLRIINPSETYGLSIHMFITDSHRSNFKLQTEKTYLLCRCTATPTMTIITNYEWTTAMMHLHQTNHNNEGEAHPKWRMVYEEKNTANQRRRNKLGEGWNFKNYVGFRRIFVRYKKTNPFLTKPWMWPLNWPNPTISNRSGANNCFGHPTFLLGHPTTQWKS